MKTTKKLFSSIIKTINNKADCTFLAQSTGNSIIYYCTVLKLLAFQFPQNVIEFQVYQKIYEKTIL